MQVEIERRPVIIPFPNRIRTRSLNIGICTSFAHLAHWLNSHSLISARKPPWMASGVWTWNVSSASRIKKVLVIDLAFLVAILDSVAVYV